jgi:hypothetical protein
VQGKRLPELFTGLLDIRKMTKEDPGAFDISGLFGYEGTLRVYASKKYRDRFVLYFTCAEMNDGMDHDITKDQFMYLVESWQYSQGEGKFKMSAYSGGNWLVKAFSYALRRVGVKNYKWENALSSLLNQKFAYKNMLDALTSSDFSAGVILRMGEKSIDENLMLNFIKTVNILQSKTEDENEKKLLDIEKRFYLNEFFKSTKSGNYKSVMNTDHFLVQEHLKQQDCRNKLSEIKNLIFVH